MKTCPSSPLTTSFSAHASQNLSLKSPGLLSNQTVSWSRLFSTSHPHRQSKGSSSPSPNRFSPRFTLSISGSFSPKKKSSSLNPVVILPKIDEALARIRKEITVNEKALADFGPQRHTKGFTPESKKSKSQYITNTKILQKKYNEINLEREKINAIAEANLHDPLKVLKLLASNKQHDNTKDAQQYTADDYNPLDNFEIFDRNTGEDSFFISPTTGDLSTVGVAFGVADGVGGWASMGVDPSAVSKGLCYYMRNIFCTNTLEHIKNQPSSSGKHKSNNALISPKALLNDAFSKLEHIEQISQQNGSKSAIAGGSTACVGIVNTFTGKLHSANLGDSGYAVYRNGKIAYQSEAQVHAFNTPYQLSIIPQVIERVEAGDFDTHKKHRKRQRAAEGNRIMDTPNDADSAVLQLKHGDVIVFATDGFWDNVFMSAALDAVNSHMLSKGFWRHSDKRGIVPVLKETKGSNMDSESAEQLASKLVRTAYANARNPKGVTPFSKEVMEELKTQYSGGKPDDTTVLVAYVHDDTYKDQELKAKL